MVTTIETSVRTANTLMICTWFVVVYCVVSLIVVSLNKNMVAVVSLEL